MSVIIHDPLSGQSFNIPTNSIEFFNNSEAFDRLPADAFSACGFFYPTDKEAAAVKTCGPDDDFCTIGYASADFDLSLTKIAVGNKYIIDDKRSDKWKDTSRGARFARAITLFRMENAAALDFPAVKDVRNGLARAPNLSLLSGGGFVFAKCSESDEVQLVLSERNSPDNYGRWQEPSGVIAHAQGGAQEIAEELSFVFSDGSQLFSIGVPVVPDFGPTEALSIKAAQRENLENILKKKVYGKLAGFVPLPLDVIRIGALGLPEGTLRIMGNGEVLHTHENTLIGEEAKTRTVVTRDAFRMDLTKCKTAYGIDGEFDRRIRFYGPDELDQAFKANPKWGLCITDAFIHGILEQRHWPRMHVTSSRPGTVRKPSPFANGLII